MATIALCSAVLGQELDERAFTAPDAPRRLHDVELSIATSDDESGTMLCSLHRRTDATGMAVLVSEKAAGDYNEGSALGAACPPGPRPEVPLSLSYPRAGTPFLDHPFAVLDRHDRPENKQRQRIIQKFFDFLAGAEAQAELRRERFRDRDGHIAPFGEALQSRPSELPLGAVDADALLQAFHDARRSARVLFLVDVSAPMAEPFRDVGGNRLRAATDAVGRALPSIGDKDEIEVWEFAEQLSGERDHRVLVPMGRPARDPGQARDGTVQDSLSQLQASNRPARLYPTLWAAATSLHESGGSRDTGDAIVIIGDGTAKEPATAELVAHLRSGPRAVPVFLIAFGTQVCSSTQWREITELTGGTCHEVSTIADIDSALDSVTAVLWGGDHG